jgi:hypothetical protein
MAEKRLLTGMFCLALAVFGAVITGCDTGTGSSGPLDGTWVAQGNSAYGMQMKVSGETYTLSSNDSLTTKGKLKDNKDHTLTLTPTHVHGSFFRDMIEEGGPDIKDKWYSRNDLKKLRARDEDVAGFFQPSTSNFTLDGDVLVLGGTTYQKKRK